jgi:hypothetical protein
MGRSKLRRECPVSGAIGKLFALAGMILVSAAGIPAWVERISTDVGGVPTWVEMILTWHGGDFAWVGTILTRDEETLTQVKMISTGVGRVLS